MFVNDIHNTTRVVPTAGAIASLASGGCVKQGHKEKNTDRLAR